MDIREHITNAFTDLSRNKLRTGLSMLWIIIGVFAVVVMLAIGNGTQHDIVDKIESLWTNLLTVSAWGRNMNMREWNNSDTAILDEDMIDYIQANVSNINIVTPLVSSMANVSYNEYTTNATINGIEPDYATVRNLTVSNGSFITSDEVDTLAKVIVLGKDIAEDIFWSGATAIDPIGQDIKVGNLVMTVIWVLEDDMLSNSAIFAPLSTVAVRIAGTHTYSSINLSALDTTIIDQTKSELESSLKLYLGLDENDTATFTVQSQSDMIEAVNDIMGIMTAFLAGIAAISLLVWGIGVMNIMLVSVTERTKEIGIRKAIWAKRKDILLQFLVESLILSLLWWVVWLFLSFVAVLVINNFLTAIISFGAVSLAFFSAVTIGIVFGILPANNASKLKPIEALRYE